ncbi:MAG: YhbY family RNA-binding protein [Casimicrobiaceae bacterium]
MPALTSIERRAMRAKAHHLEPVVFIGQHGLTPAVQHELDLALRAHELVKVRVHNDSRVERQTLLAAICSALDCAPVQHLGKLLIVYRGNPDKAKAEVKARHESRSARNSKSEPRHDAASDKRRRRNAQGGKAGNTTLPYFSRRGAGRFVAGTADADAAGAPPRTPPSHSGANRDHRPPRADRGDARASRDDSRAPRDRRDESRTPGDSGDSRDNQRPPRIAGSAATRNPRGGDSRPPRGKHGTGAGAAAPGKKFAPRGGPAAHKGPASGRSYPAPRSSFATADAQSAPHTPRGSGKPAAKRPSSKRNPRSGAGSAAPGGTSPAPRNPRRRTGG